MTLFQNLVALLLLALLLLIVARKMRVPYPTLLATAGAAFALLPSAPHLAVDPHLALALFIAPALLHAAYGASPRGLLRHWLPLVGLAVFAVLLTTAAVGLLAIGVAGLPVAAAFALGAIVAPPDAAAAEAVLSGVDMPRRGFLILQGESLLNDATALLVFGAAVAVATGGGSISTPVTLLLAGPAGILFGLAAAAAFLWIIPMFAGTLGSSLVDIASTFAVWLVADRLHISPVLAVVTFGMVVSRRRPIWQPARDRLQTVAVWSAAVLVLNVVAFMMMGLQSREVLANLSDERRLPAIGFALLVLVTVIAVRVAWVVSVRALEGWLDRRFAPTWLPKPPPWRASLIVSWSGMRGLVTMATAFALPAGFPSRDLIVLSAFTVVFGTLVVQGLTLGPLIRLLDVPEDDEISEPLSAARAELIGRGLDLIADDDSDVARALRIRYGAESTIAGDHDDPQGASSFDGLHLRIIGAQRARLHELRGSAAIDEDVYRRLEGELDWSEVEARSFTENVLRAT